MIPETCCHFREPYIPYTALGGDRAQASGCVAQTPQGFRSRETKARQTSQVVFFPSRPACLGKARPSSKRRSSAAGWGARSVPSRTPAAAEQPPTPPYPSVPFQRSCPRWYCPAHSKHPSQEPEDHGRKLRRRLLRKPQGADTAEGPARL